MAVLESRGRASFLALGKNNKWPWKQSVTESLAFLFLLIFSMATAYWGKAHFEQRLDAYARADLINSGIPLDSLDLVWNYRDVSVVGELPTGVTPRQIANVLIDSDGGGIRQVTVLAEMIPVNTDSVPATGSVDVSVTLLNGKIELAGTVLTRPQAVRLRRSAAEAVGMHNVRDLLAVSGLAEAIPGADQRIDSLANAVAGLDQAADADAELSATDFRFNATVADENQVVDLLRRRGGAGDLGLVISGDIIAKKSAPGGVLKVSALLEDGRILLNGLVPAERQRMSLTETAAAVVGIDNVVDNLVATGAVGDMQQADQRLLIMANAIASFSGVIKADARLAGNDFVFNGLLEFEENTAPLHAIRETARAQGLNVQGKIGARQISLSREVAMLQREIDLLEAEIRRTVVFDRSNSQLGFEAKQTLDKVVDAMNRYQRPVVEVKGHTDNTGTTDDNIELSLERAEFVRVYLEISGIEQNRLRSLGLGESSQIASNETEFGRKQNRRVEFRARGSFDF